jgi:hypothetical protein
MYIYRDEGRVNSSVEATNPTNMIEMDEEKKEGKLGLRRTYRIVISLRPTPYALRPGSVACINLSY